MNHALLAREAASILGALDPRPEPAIVFQGPTRLLREVLDDGRELWIDPVTGSVIADDGGERPPKRKTPEA